MSVFATLVCGVLVVVIVFATVVVFVIVTILVSSIFIQQLYLSCHAGVRFSPQRSRRWRRPVCREVRTRQW